MLESGFPKEGQSQTMKNGIKLPECRSSRCSFSQRLCIFFVMVSVVVLFFYNTNNEEMDWNLKWWIHFKSQGISVIPANMNDGNSSTTGVKTDAQNVTKASLSAFLRTQNITSQEETNMTTTPLAGNGTVIMVTQQMTQNKTMPPIPVPYVSPGPYLVEYPYQYHFIINEPRKCKQQKPFLVLMVPVAPNNRLHRDIVRNTWGGESVILGKVVKLFFLLGHTGEGAEELQQQLLQESKGHQDLIQSDFLDCYKNLTIKTMMMLEWLDSYCSNALYAMKIDSDMFLNLPNLINLLLNAPRTNYMTGLVATGARVLRDRKSKWYVPEELYPSPQYPRYALGLGYILSLDLPKKLVEASKHVKALYIEDVYLGLCMKYLGISPTDPPDWGYFHVFPVTYSRCAYSRLIATTTNKNTDRMQTWQDFKKPGLYC